MKSASASILQALAKDTRAAGNAEKLRGVAQAVVDLQQARHRADYDIAEPFDASDALLLVEQAINAFHAWNEIKDAEIAQDYLYSLLFKDRNF